LAHPIPKPIKMRPTINIRTFSAKSFNSAPPRMSTPAQIMVVRLPISRMTVDANTDATRTAKYKDDVNNVNV